MEDSRTTSTRSIGSQYEDMAAKYLTDQGWRILDRNFHSPFGEIDLIGMDREILVFIEVKYRKRTRYGTPEMAVNPAKQRKIYQTAQLYIKARGYSEHQICRFDVIAIQGDYVEHFQDAFGGM